VVDIPKIADKAIAMQYPEGPMLYCKNGDEVQAYADGEPVSATVPKNRPRGRQRSEETPEKSTGGAGSQGEPRRCTGRPPESGKMQVGTERPAQGN
jgi:hypothetical protein